MGIFRPVEEDKENAGVREPADEVVQKLFGGLIDPVEVLDHEHEGTNLALPDEEVAQGFKDLLSFVLGLEPEVRLIVDFEGKEVVERREEGFEVLIEEKTLSLIFLLTGSSRSPSLMPK